MVLVLYRGVAIVYKRSRTRMLRDYSGTSLFVPTLALVIRGLRYLDIVLGVLQAFIGFFGFGIGFWIVVCWMFGVDFSAAVPHIQ